jgi:hypothetical protein
MVPGKSGPISAAGANFMPVATTMKNGAPAPSTQSATSPRIPCGASPVRSHTGANNNAGTIIRSKPTASGGSVPVTAWRVPTIQAAQIDTAKIAAPLPIKVLCRSTGGSRVAHGQP